MAPRNDNNKNVAQTEISNAVEKDEGYIPQQKMEVPLPAKHYDGVQNVPANVQMANPENLQEEEDDYIEPKGHGNTFSQVFNAALEKAHLDESPKDAKESAEAAKEEVKKEVKKASEKLQDAAQKGLEGVTIMASAAYNSDITQRAINSATSAAETVQEKLEEARKQAEREQRAARRSAAPVDNSPAGRARALLSSIFYFATLFILAIISFGRAVFQTLKEEIQKAREAGQEAKEEVKEGAQKAKREMKKGAENAKREAKKGAEEAKSGLNRAIELARQVLMTLFLALQNGLIEGSKTLGYKAKSAEKKIEDGAKEAKEGVKQGAEEMKRSMKKASQKSD